MITVNPPLCLSGWVLISQLVYNECTYHEEIAGELHVAYQKRTHDNFKSEPSGRQGWGRLQRHDYDYDYAMITETDYDYNYGQKMLITIMITILIVIVHFLETGNEQ